MIAVGAAGCERGPGRTFNESGPGARGQPPGLSRREPGVGGVWSDVVVVEPPSLEQAPGLRQVLEGFLVQQLVAQPTDKALDEGVLLRLARRRASDTSRPP